MWPQVAFIQEKYKQAVFNQGFQFIDGEKFVN